MQSFNSVIQNGQKDNKSQNTNLDFQTHSYPKTHLASYVIKDDQTLRSERKGKTKQKQKHTHNQITGK